MVKPVVLACVLVSMAAGASLAGQDYVREPPAASEFPAADEMVRSYQLMGLRAEAAELALRTAPDRASTFDLLLKSGRIAEALTVLERIVATRPSDMRAAFAAIGTKGREIAADAAHDHASRLRASVAAARGRLGALPREEAAAIARELVNVESELALAANSWRQRLAAFVREYSGTREALLAEVHLFDKRPGPAMLEALDAFVREHPGTEAAAKALHTKGFHLAHNAFSFGERAGDDPTDRFFRVLDIYLELRSGRYPPSEWVDQASSLVTGFNAYRASFEPGNAERVLTVYEALLPALLEAFERGDTRESIPFFVGSRMGALFRLTGDPVPAIERVFDRLERLAKNANAVKLLRAEFYLRPTEPVVEAEDRPALRAKARSLLESLVAAAAGFERRKALATLATLYFKDGELAQARTLYEQYLDAYPESDYAWVAALRIGECGEAADPEAAAESFRRAASRLPTNPVARVLGHAYAARAWEAAGDFGKALLDYEAALRAWDARYGGRYSLFSRRQTPPGGSFPIDLGEVTRERLQGRIAALTETTATPGGELVERARLALSGGRWDEGIAAASEFLSNHPASPLAADARYLLHTARLEKALEIAGADDSGAAIAQALAELETLTRQPMDSAVAAAKLALGTARYLSGAAETAGALIAGALGDWQDLDRSAPSIASRGAFEKDVVDVRNAVFRPDGGGLLRDGRWSSFTWPASLPFVLTSPALRVKSGGDTRRVVAYDPFPHVPNAVFLDDERRTLLERIMARLGGTKKRPWVQVMQTPNQPDGPALDVLALWRKTFWAQPGHWGGWIFEGFPIINEIEFVDDSRSKAAVKIRVGYTGGTVQLEKRDGAWTMTGLTNFWIE